MIRKKIIILSDYFLRYNIVPAGPPWVNCSVPFMASVNCLNVSMFDNTLDHVSFGKLGIGLGNVSFGESAVLSGEISFGIFGVFSVLYKI